MQQRSDEELLAGWKAEARCKHGSDALWDYMTVELSSIEMCRCADLVFMSPARLNMARPSPTKLRKERAA